MNFRVLRVVLAYYEDGCTQSKLFLKMAPSDICMGSSNETTGHMFSSPMHSPNLRIPRNQLLYFSY